MTEYTFKRDGSGSHYNSSDMSINIDLYLYKSLSKKEIEFMIYTTLEHEHLHRVIHKIESKPMAILFEIIGHKVRTSNEKFLKIARKLGITTWENVINMEPYRSNFNKARNEIGKSERIEKWMKK